MAKRDKNFNYFSSFERMGNFSYQAAEMLQEILEYYDSEQIGRASVGKECRSRWAPYH